MLNDIGHPYARGEPVYDITFENVQAGERTSHLFRLANLHSGIVVGTGDLSELALGWCTYGVGDHMSHYNVNASVPKTLIKHLVRWVAARAARSSRGDDDVLRDILGDRDQPRAGARATATATQPEQSTEASDRPLRAAGLPPLLHAALRLRADQGGVPGATPPGTTRRAGAGPTAPTWRATHTRWPRSSSTSAPSSTASSRPASSSARCVPNAPKVGSGGSLSPRGDWRAPSDSEATVWLDDVERIPDASTSSAACSAHCASTPSTLLDKAPQGSALSPFYA